MIKLVLSIIACHLIGDYVLQSAYIAETKSKNMYHLMIHCFLYCLSYAIWFGLDYRIGLLFISHVIIDSLRYKFKKIKISYITDQILHYIIAFILFGFLN